MTFKLPSEFWKFNVNTVIVILTWVFTMGIFYNRFEMRLERLEDDRMVVNALAKLPDEFDHIARELEPLRAIPGRVQSLEERSHQQAITFVRHQEAIDEMRRFIGEVSTQLSVAAAKLDDIRARTTRIENKVDEK
jgi:hypothetical protein